MSATGTSVHEPELTSPDQDAVSLAKEKLGLTGFHDQYLKVPYVKDGCHGTVWRQRAKLG